MAKLDVVKAATAGFGVIGRNPLAVAVWGVLLLVVGVAPVFLLMGGFMSSVMQLAALQETGVEPDPAMMAPMMASMIALYPVLFITSILIRVIMTGAIFRSVLEPENRRWFFVRLGAQELWMALVMVVIVIIAAMVGGVLAIFLGGTVGVAAVASGGSDAPPLWFMPVFGIVGLAAAVVFVWLALRFSMALPMSFAERQFRLFESWTFTRGHVGGLFLIALLLIAIIFILEIVLWILGVLVFGLVIAGTVGVAGMDEHAIEAFFRQPPAVWMATLAPWLIIGGLVVAVIGSAVTTLLTAPWAEAYRQIKGEAPAAEPAPATL